MEQDNPENFDDGITRVAPEGKFKPMNEKVVKLILEIKKKWEITGSGINYWWVKWINKAFEEGHQEARKEILDFIETERDNGNIEGEKGFSAGLCLSKLMKELKDKKE